MSLPKLEVPTYEIELPLSKQKLKYRPYLVKEQKSLMMAMESGDASSIQSIVKDILTVCTLTPGVDIDDIPIVDIEYYFVNLRAKSVGEVVESKYRCNNLMNDEECGTIMESKLNLNDLHPESEVVVSPEINLTDNVMVKMSYPKFSVIKDSIEFDNITDVTFNLIASSIEYIYDGEQYHYAKETTKEELITWLEQLSQPQFEKIEDFFINLPKMKKKIKMTCKKCQFQHEIFVEGLESFFGF